jgi:hypothetical protein
VEARKRHAQLKSKQSQLGLDRNEEKELEQLELFATV